MHRCTIIHTYLQTALNLKLLFHKLIEHKNCLGVVLDVSEENLFHITIENEIDGVVKRNQIKLHSKGLRVKYLFIILWCN